MKKYILTIAVFALPFQMMYAQTKKKTFSATKFTSIIQAGILEGEADRSYGQFQLVNGIQRNAWFYGLGLGIDYYGSKRSIPLFFDVRRDLIKGRKTPFVYVDAGYNCSWLREKEKITYWGTDYKAKGGPYFETGFGYKFILKNKATLGVSAGYSFKQQKETFKRQQFFDAIIPTPAGYVPPPDVFDYKFRRICLKLNCSF